MAWYTNAKLWSAIGGATAALILERVAKVPCVRETATKAASKVIITKENANAAIQSFKDDTEDLCEDARAEAKIKAEAAEKAAAIEERIRAEVEAEMAAEKAADAE